MCGGRRHREVWSLSAEQIRDLWRECGREFSSEAFESISPGHRVSLYECGDCGFRFFDPRLAGGARFYEELEKQPYYVADRPEFKFALGLGRGAGLKTVLDVGGGEGAFLDLARRAGMTTMGLELNPTAAAISAGKGHRMLSGRLAEVSSVEIGAGVDLLTLFQVVEHVPAPRDFIREAVGLVRPGGFLVLAVPHEEGVFRWLPWDPTNMPPHHVSRWRRSDLVRLGESCGLRVHSVGADVLFGRAFEAYFPLHNRLARRIGEPVRLGGEWLPRVLSLAYRTLGCRHYLPRKGLAVYAAFQKA